MKEKNLNERKARVLTIVTTVLLLVIVIGATYAYFQAQVGNGTNTSINATTGTTDVLTFSMQDLDASNEEKKVTDEEEDTNNPEIVINANEENFGKEGETLDNSLADGVTAKANLKANDATNTAVKQTYNVYLLLKENDLVHTQGENIPELILNVQMPNGEEKELKTIKGLKYYEYANGFSGFDITEKKNITYEIAKDYEIEVTLDDNGEVTQEWEITVTLINMDKDQTTNAGKKLKGEIIITKEEQENVFKIPEVESITVAEEGANNLKFNINGTKGTNEIKEYNCMLKEGEIEKETKLANIINEEKTEATVEFTELDANVEYTLEITMTDIEENSSEKAIQKGMTIKPTCNEGESTKDCLVRIDKEQHEEPTLIYHDGLADYSDMPNYTLEAGDLSYRYSGGNYKISKDYINDFDDIYPGYSEVDLTKKYVIRFNCNGEEKYIGYSCTYYKSGFAYKYPNYFYIFNNEQEQFSTLYEALNKAYDYGYIEKNVKNYVYFGCKNNLCTKDDLYRIIGLFKNNKDEYEMKLIKADYANMTELGTGSSYGEYNRDLSNYQGNGQNLGEYFWNKSSSTNNWRDSNLNKVNLNTEYYNSLGTTWQKMIAKHTWIVGGNSYDNIIWQTSMKTVYNNEVGIDRLKIEAEGCKDSLNQSRNCLDEDLTYPYEGMDIGNQVTKIGLMYVSDYGYAVYPSSWESINEDFYDELKENKNKNWMYMGLSEWTISRNSKYNDIFLVNDGGYVGSTGINLGYAVRPTFYLSSDVKITNGNGSEEKPFVLELS